MISQKCPKCFSKRVRRGYRPTPLWSKILFRYNLLCDNCNWEFVGFAVPGTVSAKPTRNPKKKQPIKLIETSDNHKSNETSIETSMDYASNNSVGSLEKETEKEIDSLAKEEKEEAAEKSGANENLAHKSVKTKKKVKRKSGV